ncbi:hypothetical protein [Algoriphagus sp. AK58]|uniref:hypothetical protein n=1 Tax=Algoriphagus sp. AK58 TaxID=1406877 RepID=UPI00164EF687|nr:hypothetical protein [Algoriphagus sp. AK58]MBC6366776.1 hypothetical protein [Algoriphagus sp. AK58]
MEEARLNRLLTVPVDFDIKESFAKAWELFKAQALLHIIYMMLILSIQGIVVIYIQEYMILYSALLAPPLYSGFFLVANKISRGESVMYPDFFGGFRFWMPLVAISLLSQVLVALGLFALIIPGVYLAVGYLFSMLMGIFGGLDVWSAMEWSRKLITRNWWQFFALLMILIAMNVIGLLLAGIGLLVTFPMTFLVLYVIFEQLTQDVFSEEEVNITHEPQS